MTIRKTVFFIAIVLAAITTSTTAAAVQEQARIPGSIAGLTPTSIIHEHVVPAQYSTNNGAEMARVTQVNIVNGEESSPDKFMRVVSYSPLVSSVDIVYQTSRGFDGACYRDELIFSSDVPTRTMSMKPRMRTKRARTVNAGRETSIKDTAFRILDAQVCLECYTYAYEGKSVQPDGTVRITGTSQVGKNAAYDTIEILLGYQHDTVVPLEVTLDGRTERFESYVKLEDGRVRYQRVTMIDPVSKTKTRLDFEWLIGEALAPPTPSPIQLACAGT